MSQPARTKDSGPCGTFGEADLDSERLGLSDAATVYPPPWQPGQSDIQALTVPPGEFPSQNLPGSIEEAVLAALDQVPRAASVPQAAPTEWSDTAPADVAVPAQAAPTELADAARTDDAAQTDGTDAAATPAPAPAR